ncbi:villin-1-like [Callorhinchus milii]|uniref:villin-1-like n=1 Tax=Callorhinchus milii TaxID=7868 RepID=UPI001C3FC09C|nr:villin-1-like [Callorhinchus milii]
MPCLSPVIARSLQSSAGVRIWRIEKMEMEPVPQASYGNFYEGDCYIVLATRKIARSLCHDVYFWLGRQSSQDEQGAAAIYTTQIDDALQGAAVQHREVQRHESESFRSLFKKGLIYKRGGVASGLKHVETNTYDVQRLLHVKGRKHVYAGEVEMAWTSFNKGDVFLLDLGKLIVQWNGPLSNRMERLKGMQLAKDIRDRERGGRTQIAIVEGDNETASPQLMRLMYQLLGERREIKLPIPDELVDCNQRTAVKLYHVSDADGNLMVHEVAARPLTQNLLNSNDCYILDQGGIKIFVWKGKLASKEERQLAITRALGFIRAKGYPLSTNVETQNEGAESAIFKQLFQKWMVKYQTVGLGKTHTVGKIAKVEQVKFDAMEMHARPELAARHQMVDDGSGDIEVWRIEDLELVPVERRWHGHFYGGDCYLILYTYRPHSRNHYILYIWQGRHASQDEITASALLAVGLDQQYGGEPVQVRVTMGKEPQHLMSIFKNKFIVYEGGTSRSCRVEPEPGVRLFQIHGRNEYSTKAFEVPARASSLNSNDVFVLNSDLCCYLWYGKGCSGDEREMAKILADIIAKREKPTVYEGKEPANFWAVLGGKAPYCNDKRFHEEHQMVSPRLFECSNQTGRFIATEIMDFDQEDLDEDDVMLLDTWDQVFLWFGKGANETEKKNALVTAQEYLHSHPSKRDTDTPIIIVKQSFEPPTFTGWFMAWDHHKWAGRKSYDELKFALGDPTGLNDLMNDMRKLHLSCSKMPTFQAPTSNFSAHLLVNIEPENLPEGIDPTRKEEYLCDSDFRGCHGDITSELQRHA